MSSRVEGMSKTSAALKRMGPEVTKQITDALDKGAQEIASKARQIAPRDTGAMAGAIEVRNTLDGFTATGAVGNFARQVQGAADGLTRFVGVFPASRSSPGWYAAFVEFGNTKRAPKPFLKPAFFVLRTRVVNRIKASIRRATKEVASRGGSNS